MKDNIFKLLTAEIGHGVIQQVSNRSGISYPTVLRCFQGKSKNIIVLEAAASILKEHRDRLSEIGKLLIAE